MNISTHFTDCVVPENIHTPTTEGIGHSRGVRGVKGPGNSGGEGGLEAKFTSKWKEIDRLTSYIRLCHLPTFVGRSEV